MIQEYVDELYLNLQSQQYTVIEIALLKAYIDNAAIYNTDIEYNISLVTNQRLSDMYYNQSELIHRIISTYYV